MMSREDYQADRYEELEEARAQMAYEEALEAGFEGTFKEFLQDVAASRAKSYVAPVETEVEEDDIPF